MRLSRIVGGVAAGLLLAGASVAAPAMAAPATRIVNTVSDVSCVFETVEGDYTFFTASSSTLGGSGSDIFVEGPESGLVLESLDGTATLAPGGFSAIVPLIDVRTQEPAGTATVSGTRTQFGEPVTEELRERSGNSWTTGTVTTPQYQVDLKSVSVPGYQVLDNDDDCTSEDIAFDVRTTNPNATIYRDTDFESAICALEGLPNGEVLLTGTFKQPHFEVVIDDGAAPQKASGDLQMQGHSGQASVPLIDLTIEQAIAQLQISVDLTRMGRRQQDAATFDGITERVSWVPYRASITVSTSDGRSGTADCYAEYITSKIIIRPGPGE